MSEFSKDLLVYLTAAVEHVRGLSEEERRAWDAEHGSGFLDFAILAAHAIAIDKETK